MNMNKFKRLLIGLLIFAFLQQSVYCQYAAKPEEQDACEQIIEVPQDEPQTLAVSNIVDVYFSPQGAVVNKLLEFIAKSKTSLLIAVYWFSDKSLADALIAIKECGVDIQVVVDQSCFENSCEQVSFLKENGVPVFVWIGAGIMHDKFAICDASEVWTGSYNWTVKADEQNKENAIIIRDAAVADKYKKEFDGIRLKVFYFNVYNQIASGIKQALETYNLDLSNLNITNLQLKNLLEYLISKGINRFLIGLDLYNNNLFYRHKKFKNFVIGDDTLDLLESFTKLRDLNLKKNRLNFIPYFVLINLPSLKYLNLKENQLMQTQQIESYLNDLKVKGINLYR